MRLRRDYQVQEAVPDPVAEIGPLVVQPKPPPEGTRCIHQQRKMAAVAALVLLGCAAVVTSTQRRRAARVRYGRGG